MSIDRKIARANVSGNFNEPNIQKYVQKMTNWQRKQWHRGGSKVDVVNLEYYVNLQYPTRKSSPMLELAQTDPEVAETIEKMINGEIVASAP